MNIEEITIKTIAEKLNWMKYEESISKEIIDICKTKWFVIVTWYSDDNMMFNWKIDDEKWCYWWWSAYVTRKWELFQSECEDYYCPYAEKEKEKSFEIEADVNNEDYYFIFKTNIPHETFEVLEGDWKYCRWIVFDVNNLK